MHAGGTVTDARIGLTKVVRRQRGFTMSVSQREAVRKLIKESPRYRFSTDLVLAVVNKESIDIPDFTNDNTESCIWSASLSYAELTALDQEAKQAGQDYPDYFRDYLFAPKAVDVPDIEESGVEEKPATVGVPMTEGQRNALRRFIKESPTFRTASDMVLAVALGEPALVPDVDESLTDRVNWTGTVSPEDKEVVEEAAREQGMSVAAFLRQGFFGDAGNSRRKKVVVDAVPPAPVLTPETQRDIVPEPTPEPENIADTNASTEAPTVEPTPKPALPKPVAPAKEAPVAPKTLPKSTLSIKQSDLTDAYILNGLHTQAKAMMMGALARLDSAADGESTGRALEELADIANLYARLTSEPGVFWRTVLRTADEVGAPTSTYHRVLLWAGTLESSRLTLAY
jgi:hypothetical protein